MVNDTASWSGVEFEAGEILDFSFTCVVSQQLTVIENSNGYRFRDDDYYVPYIHPGVTPWRE